MWIDDLVSRLWDKLLGAQQEEARGTAHRCSYCRQPGHNKRTCAELRADTAAANRAAAEAQRRTELAAQAEAARRLAEAMAVYGE